MAQAISTAIDSSLSFALSQWRHWQTSPALSGEPTVVSSLGDTNSNVSFLVSVDNQLYVVRISRDADKKLTASPLQEFCFLSEAASQQLAPTPRYFAQDYGVLVCDYLAPDDKQEDIADNPHAIATLLRSLHALPAVHRKLDLQAVIDHYYQQLDPDLQTSLAAQHDRVSHQLKQLDNQDNQVPNHCDLLLANRLVHDQRLYAIDFEYGAMAACWYDLAVIICGDDLNETDAAALVSAYLQREPSDYELAQLALYQDIYRYVERLWTRCFANQRSS